MLSEKASAILRYVENCIDDGIPPSVREICSELGIKSTSTVHKYLKELEEKGYIIRGENLNRSIKLAENSGAFRHKDNVSSVPLVGTVAAGMPILAIENIEEYIPYKSSYSKDELFALRIKGDSMINIGMFEGDIIIVRKTSYAENGQIIVALVDDEATVKRFYKENGHFRLQPENDDMEPIIVQEVSILGKVIALIRDYGI